MRKLTTNTAVVSSQVLFNLCLFSKYEDVEIPRYQLLNHCSVKIQNFYSPYKERCQKLIVEVGKVSRCFVCLILNQPVLCVSNNLATFRNWKVIADFKSIHLGTPDILYAIIRFEVTDTVLVMVLWHFLELLSCFWRPWCLKIWWNC